MRILHFADLHLGVETYGRLDPTTGLPTRLLDFLASLDRLVDYAIANAVDLVLFCGDAYKSREPTQTQQREFAKRINRLSSAGIPTFLLIGNHDLPNAIGRATSTEIFDTLAVRNVYVSNRPDLHRIPTPHGDVQVVSLPWLRRSALLSKEESRDLNFQESNRKLQQVLTDIIREKARELDPAVPAVLAAHVWVTGARVGSEGTMTIGQEHVLLLSSVAHPAFDYVALGHIHRGQVLSARPAVVYSGSLDRLDFGDAGDDKGFYVVDIGPGSAGQRQVSFRFQPVPGRRFTIISVSIDSEADDPTSIVLSAIEEQRDAVRDAIVRLEINLPTSGATRLRDNEIRSALKEAHWFNIGKNVSRETRLRLGQFTTGEAAPLDVLSAYLQSRQLTPEKTRLLLEYGQRLIEEKKAKSP